MVNEKFKYYRLYYNFLRTLAKELTNFYYKKSNKPFKVKNKLKGKGFDPVTSSDKALEKFIRFKIKKNSQRIKLSVKNMGIKKQRVILPGLLIQLMELDLMLLAILLGVI